MQSEPTTCPNCGALVTGTYCSNCGQHRADVRISVGRLVRDALEEQLSVNSALPRTLRALFFHPGRLTNEYLAGRIVRYIPPFRLYLISSLLFFVLLSFLSRSWEVNVKETGSADSASVTRDSTARRDSSQSGLRVSVSGPGQTRILDSAEVNLGSEWLNRRVRARIGQLDDLPQEEALRRLIAAALRQAPKIVFLLLPVFALLLKLVYIRRKRYYVEHFIFALHVHSFAFLLFFIMLLARAHPVVLTALWLWHPVYTLIAMKRVYAQGWLKTFLKWGTIGFLYMFLLSLGLVFTFVAAVFTV